MSKPESIEATKLILRSLVSAPEKQLSKRLRGECLNKLSEDGLTKKKINDFLSYLVKQPREEISDFIILLCDSACIQRFEDMVEEDNNKD